MALDLLIIQMYASAIDQKGIKCQRCGHCSESFPEIYSVTLLTLLHSFCIYYLGDSWAI